MTVNCDEQTELAFGKETLEMADGSKTLPDIDFNFETLFSADIHEEYQNNHNSMAILGDS